MNASPRSRTGKCLRIEMSVEKTKTIDFDGDVFTIETEVKSKRRSCVLRGKPMVAVYDKFIQIGCMRIAKSVVREMAKQINNQPPRTAVLLQVGDYSTKDPNTK